MNPSRHATPCKRVAAGGDCQRCGGDATGIAGAAAYVPVTSDLDRCARCDRPVTPTNKRRRLDQVTFRLIIECPDCAPGKGTKADETCDICGAVRPGL